MNIMIKKYILCGAGAGAGDYEEQLLALRSTCWQPGIATNLAIWHNSQSGNIQQLS